MRPCPGLILGVLAMMTLMASVGQARVFDINSETSAGYFMVSGGKSTIGKAGFQNEANNSITYDKQVDYNYGGEFGFLYSRPQISFRFGFEIFKPQSLTDVTAKNGATDAYTLKSDFIGYAPKFGVEFNIHRSDIYRTFVQGYVGSVSMNLKNDYTILNYPGVSSHSIEAKGTGTVYGGSLGVETLFTDATTYMFELGYRTLAIDSFTYTKAVSTFGGAKAVGDVVTDASGVSRSVQLTGVYISLGFRFYL